MPIPDLDAYGLLPSGAHACTVAELRARFAFNGHRRALLRRLCRFIRAELRPLAFACPLYVDGSYVRKKVQPSDVDVVLDVERASLEHKLAALKLFFERPRLKSDHRVDFWIRLPGVMPNDLALFFQYLGDKAAAELGLKETWPKGILRIDL